MTPLLDLYDQDSLLDRLVAGARDDHRPVVFLVGSPLTAPSAPGEPGVPGVAAMIEAAQRALEGEVKVPQPGATSSYQSTFHTLLGRRGPDIVNRVVRQAVLQACVNHPETLLKSARDGDRKACEALEEDVSGWYLSPGVESLGRLVARYPQQFGRAVLTSNFDPLIEISTRRAGRPSWHTTLHDDGRLQLGRSAVGHVIHVHGYWYGTDTLHLPSQLQTPRPHLRNSLRRLFEDVTLVVVAYGGWDDVFTRAVFDAVSDGGAFPDVIWTFHTGDAGAIEAHSQALLEGLGPGLGRGRVTLYRGIDCHLLFPALSQRLAEAGVAESAVAVTTPVPAPGSPAGASGPNALSPFVAGPPIERDEDLFGRKAQRQRLRDAVKLGQPVQILGERRMGKTSLLRWVERHAGEWRDWPVAWVNAQGLAGSSPERLVLEVAWSLARLPEADAAFQREGTSSRGAADVLQRLLPLVILVDESSALAEPGHGFDADFLGALRTFGQDKRLLWISTSHEDLQGLFRETGLASNFLNDSRQVWVGQLEPEAARSLVAPLGWERAVEVATEEADGFAYGLQWLGDALWRQGATRGADAAASAMELQAIQDAYAQAMTPVFGRWWEGRSPEERALLWECVVGVAASSLSPGRRRKARALTQRGLVTELQGHFLVPGGAWRTFIEEA